MEPTIALVFSPEPWVERLHRHLADHGGARVRDIVLEPALALEDHYDTLVVSHRWPGLTRPFVDADSMFGTQDLPLPAHILAKPYAENPSALFREPYWGGRTRRVN